DEAKSVASKQGVTFRVLLEEGLRSAIDARKRRAAAPFRLRDGSFKGNGQGMIQPMDWSEIRDLIYEGRGGNPKELSPSIPTSWSTPIGATQTCILLRENRSGVWPRVVPLGVYHGHASMSFSGQSREFTSPRLLLIWLCGRSRSGWNHHPCGLSASPLAI